MTDVTIVDAEIPAPEEKESGQGLAPEPEGAQSDLDDSADAGDVEGTETDKDAPVEDDDTDEGGEG